MTEDAKLRAEQPPSINECDQTEARKNLPEKPQRVKKAEKLSRNQGSYLK